MAWVSHENIDEALESEDGVYELITDPVYGYLNLRLIACGTQLGEFGTVREADAYIASNPQT